MLAEPINIEQSIVESLAQRYRNEGYEVLVKPSMNILPGALQQFKPDLLARRGLENIVVEVKRRRAATSEARARTEQLAAVVSALPNWQFELVVIDDAIEGPASDGLDWSVDDVRRALNEIDGLIQDGRTESAVLLLFAALEAHLRFVAAAEGIVVSRDGVGPLISALTSAGILSREEYKGLMDGLAARNAVAHGRRPEPMLGKDALHRLARIVREVGRNPPAIPEDSRSDG